LWEIYWGTAAATLPINLESDIGLPQYHLIEGVVLGDYWSCSKRQKKKPKKMETRTLIIPDFVSMLKTDAAGFPLPCA
jgi:hypothetical protein